MKEWWVKLSVYKALSDLVVLIFLLGIALNMITPNFYKIMIVPLLIGLFATLIYILNKIFRKNE